MPEPSSETDHRRRRLERAEALLDRWLDLFEQALDAPAARVDASRTVELANVFAICRRILEIEQLDRRLQEGNATGHEPAAGIVDPHLFGDGVPAPGGDDSGD
ncbi:MAG: hypothetical protein KF858_05240 [Candidatus Sumerlaeia bacterium]|nr:hypothetical protein [Candidatus Sumerlaeia bacterium]